MTMMIDEKLMADAMAATGFRTKRATIEYALWVVIRMKDPQAAIELRKTLEWSREVTAKFREDQALVGDINPLA